MFQKYVFCIDFKFLHFDILPKMNLRNVVFSRCNIVKYTQSQKAWIEKHAIILHHGSGEPPTILVLVLTSYLPYLPWIQQNPPNALLFQPI